MRSEIILAGFVVGGAVLLARTLDNMEIEAANEGAVSAQPTFASAVPADDFWNDEVRIKAAPDHQFYISADVNRSAARFLVDTGASYVALRDSDARNAGIYTSHADYTYPVKTANGETRAALVTVDEIEIGNLRVTGVKAFVLQDEQLAINLLGMSFLSRLESVEARGGELVLRG